jgi:outer membrane protein assembly factor BamB
MPTLLVYRGLLYACADSGLLTCRDPATGSQHYRVRLGSRGTSFSASPVAAGGRLYLAAERGKVYVVAAGTEHRLIQVNETGETCMATPAVSGGVLYLRTRHHLLAVGK